MWGGMILGLTGEIARQAACADAEDRAMEAKVASGVPREQAQAEMRAERNARFKREREFAQEMQRMLHDRERGNGIDPLYLGAAFLFGMAIG